MFEFEQAGWALLLSEQADWMPLPLWFSSIPVQAVVVGASEVLQMKYIVALPHLPALRAEETRTAA